jgi:hypothetical protein
MTQPRAGQSLAPFFESAAAYLAQPGVVAAMDLAQSAERLKQAAACELADDALVALLHRLLAQVRAGDAAGVAEALGAVRARLATLGIAAA